MMADAKPGAGKGSAWVGRLAWPLLGMAITLGLWAVAARYISDVDVIRSAFAPQAGLKALLHLLGSGELWPHISTSLQRIAIALVLALSIGVPLGLCLGLSPLFARISGPTFQFLRMVSPLSWMPLAVMALGVGEAPVIFLLAFATVWPIMLNTAAGVAALDPAWMRLAHSLSATRWETIARVVLPGCISHILTGFRLAVGIGWIVLVPAEMLGVSSGLGYFVLDTRDRLAYDELMAGIVVIGCLGFVLDWLARTVSSHWLQRG
ncbi:NitT/TauT family transport system permease protein [Comamonas sp. BIGb0152]|nr:NitT/TauT family transport system permease protein [Comamonas sp. BIGb0152]